MSKRTPQRSDRIAVLPAPFPPLDRLECSRCGTRGVTVIVMWFEEADRIPRELFFCAIDCARHAGWPWLGTGRRPRPAVGAS